MMMNDGDDDDDSAYDDASDDVSPRCRLAASALEDLTVKFGGRAAWYRHGAPASASACSCALASSWGGRSEVN